MQESSLLYNQIRQAIKWNAFSYTLFKVISTALTFLLYKHLSTNQFALWTGINSLAYLVLLWTDFGMRKTIPTFLPQIPESSRRRFIGSLVTVYNGALLAICPLMLWIIARYAHAVSLPMNNALLLACAVLFLGHGLEMLLQTIFHAYLWHKTYNSLLATIQIAYMLTVIIALFFFAPSYTLVWAIIFGKGVASLLCALVGSILLQQKLPLTQSYILDPLFKQHFFTHAGIMWATTALKSLSERNITVPLVTYALGPALGNLFKVTQDGALLLQRLIFRTIGTTDTSLFAHLKPAQVSDNKHIKAAFTSLALQFAYLTAPLIGLVWFMQCQVYAHGSAHYGFTLFFGMAIALLLELLLTPYERMLEVHAQYYNLAYAYIVYVVSILVLFGALLSTCLTLTHFVIALFTIRLLSMIVMAYTAYRIYHVRYPLKKISIVICCALIIAYLIHIICSHLCDTTLLQYLNYCFNL